jgi:hypothetical protein
MAQYGQTQQAGAQAEQEERSLEEVAGVDPKELVAAAAEFARENPHTAVAAAFGIGFLLGGGLTPRILASIALFAGRKYAAQAAREALEGAVRQQIEDATAGNS